MRKVLVTGGAGFLGSSIVRELGSKSLSVRVLARPEESLENLKGLDGVEVVRGDVMSVDDCRRATTGIDTVFHCAAIYKDYVRDPTAMYHVNQRGTFNVLEAARRSDVERVVYTASVVGLGRPARGRVADETTPYDAWDLNFHYSRSKHLSMLTAFDFANWGLDVRIVSPAVVFGPGDVGPTPSGKIILAVCAGKAPAYSSGGSPTSTCVTPRACTSSRPSVVSAGGCTSRAVIVSTIGRSSTPSRGSITVASRVRSASLPR